MTKRTRQLVEGIQTAAASDNVPIQAGCAGSMFGFYFLKQDGQVISDYANAKQYADTVRYAKFFHALLEAGVYLAPSQFEAGFMSSAHSDEIIQQTVGSIADAMKQIAS
jgi:glutamate-1-semialdehyde 2,1-aminomutase